jgi:hypothetical protein
MSTAHSSAAAGEAAAAANAKPRKNASRRCIKRCVKVVSADRCVVRLRAGSETNRDASLVGEANAERLCAVAWPGARIAPRVAAACNGSNGWVRLWPSRHSTRNTFAKGTIPRAKCLIYLLCGSAANAVAETVCDSHQIARFRAPFARFLGTISWQHRAAATPEIAVSPESLGTQATCRLARSPKPCRRAVCSLYFRLARSPTGAKLLGLHR